MFCGCQFSLYPMSDNFVEVILPAVKAMRDFDGADGLRIETDDISTLVVGPPSGVFAAVERAYEAACRAGGHVVLSALFSRGCPGEPDDPICTPEGPTTGTAGTTASDSTTASDNKAGSASEEATSGAGKPPSGLKIDAQFSLYPLGISHYMESIAGAVAAVKEAEVFDRSKHFCTRLSGDLAHVLAAVEDCFASAARDTGHVVIHLTASKGSPSKKSSSSNRAETYKEN